MAHRRREPDGRHRYQNSFAKSFEFSYMLSLMSSSSNPLRSVHPIERKIEFEHIDPTFTDECRTSVLRSCALINAST